MKAHEDRIRRLAAAIEDITGIDADTAEWLALTVFRILAAMKLDSQNKPYLSEAKVALAMQEAGSPDKSQEAFAEGELIEYSASRAAIPRNEGAWMPGVFRSYPHGPDNPEITVRQLHAVLRRQNSYVIRQASQVRRVDPQLISAARAWIADCAWPDLGEGDVGDLTDIEVAAGIQRHYSGGWAGFKLAGGERS